MNLVTYTLVILSSVSAQCSASNIPSLLPFTAPQNLIIDFAASASIFNNSGQLLQKSQTTKPPQIGTTSALLGAYVLLMVDPDYNATVPTNTVLHYLLPGLRSAPNTTRFRNSTFVPLTSKSAPAAAYIGPQPTSPLPHNYTLLLFAQPANFSVPSAFAAFLPLNISNPLNRVNFPVVNFVNETGLGSPIAANYFKEGNLNVTNSSSPTIPTASASMVSA